MYSLILMTAMSGAPEAPEFNGFFRNLFNGCQGESCYGCYGSGVSRSAGCYGSCHGFGSRIRTFFNGGSCYGSGVSRSAGCYGASYACIGASYSCGGGYGVPPVSDGFGVPPAADGFAPYAPPAPAVPGSAHLPADAGCCGDGYTLGTPATVADPFPTPFSTTPPTRMPAGPPASVPEDRNARRAALASPAGDDKARGTVVVKLPADAKLYAEGRPLTQTSGERTFVTPPLPGRARLHLLVPGRVRAGRGDDQPVEAGGGAARPVGDGRVRRPDTGEDRLQAKPGAADPADLGEGRAGQQAK